MSLPFSTAKKRGLLDSLLRLPEPRLFPLLVRRLQRLRWTRRWARQPGPGSRRRGQPRLPPWGCPGSPGAADDEVSGDGLPIRGGGEGPRPPTTAALRPPGQHHRSDLVCCSRREGGGPVERFDGRIAVVTGGGSGIGRASLRSKASRLFCSAVQFASATLPVRPARPKGDRPLSKPFELHIYPTQ